MRSGPGSSKRFIHVDENPVDKDRFPVLVVGRAVIPLGILGGVLAVVCTIVVGVYAIVTRSLEPIGILLCVCAGLYITTVIVCFIYVGVHALVNSFKEVNRAYRE